MKTWKILNIGAPGVKEKEGRKIRLVNLMAVITVIVSSAYLIFYIAEKARTAIYINSAVVICYGLTFLFNQLRQYRFAKNWLYGIYCIHLFILTEFVFSKATGFHFYYFAVPLTLFLVFEYTEKLDKVMLTAVSLTLFYVCELFTFQAPLIVLSRTVNQVLYLSSILTIFFGIVVVVYLYTHDIRLVEKQREDTIRSLKQALREIHHLRGILPICARCKKIRDDKGYWRQIESYIAKHSDAEFSHSICPDCAKKLYPDIDIYKNSGIEP